MIAGELLLTTEAMLELVRFRAALLVYPYHRLRPLIHSALERQAALTDEDREFGRRVARLVDHAARPLRANCLCRSLALWSMLARRGIRTTLVLGVRRDEGRFSGHAWVSADKVALNETAENVARFHVLEEQLATETTLPMAMQ